MKGEKIMEEKKLLEELLKSSSFREAFRQLMIEDPYLAGELGASKNSGSTVCVWCVEMETVDGKQFYHPIVIPNSDGMMPDVTMMMDPEYYTMMYTEDQFSAYDYEAKIDFMKSVYPNIKIRMLTIPKTTFEMLKESLHTLVVEILSEINSCFAHYERIEKLTHANMDLQKVELLSSVFGNMTVVATCINKDMSVIDSTAHAYVPLETNEYCCCCDDDCDDYEDDDSDNDWCPFD